jgi:Flp pilus assembly protein TadG
MAVEPQVMRAGTRGERGETLVEFAFALVVFVMTMLGTAQFGLIIFRYNMMSDLAQEGARWASVRGQGSGAMAASQADVQTYVQSRALGMNVSVSTNVDPSALKAGDTIQVQVQHSFNPFTRIVRVGGFTVQSTAQMVMYR